MAHATGIERMFVHQHEKVKESELGNPQRAGGSGYSRAMAKRHEPNTEELRQLQRERTTEEHRAVGQSVTPDEKKQHRRRAEKSAYLERMLAERERSERRDGRD
jgi:hypothetical protein